MAKSTPFEADHGRYDAWFEKHAAAAYVSELLALRPFVPIDGRGLEIGVGSGCFAAPPWRASKSGSVSGDACTRRRVGH